MRLEIQWTPYFQDTEYGMVGQIKAFSLVERDITYALYPRLPDRQGVPCPAQEFRSRREARDRAEDLLREFLADFLAGVPRQRNSATTAS